MDVIEDIIAVEPAEDEETTICLQCCVIPTSRWSAARDWSCFELKRH